MLMKIGEFSKLSRVSVRMLRHYDEIGLLKPAETDPWTDYRYYRADQLPTMCRIAALKDIGFSLAEIAQMLTEDEDRMEERFDRRQRQLEAEARDVAQKRMLLDAARNRLRKDETMSYHITLKTIPARYAATIQMTVPRYQDEGLLWAAMCEETAGLKMTETDPCLLGVTYLDGEYKENNVELLGWETVKGQYPDTEHVKFRTLPEVRVASCTFRGDYQQINRVYAAMGTWIQENGFETTGETFFNIYHVGYKDTQDPSAFITEACWPIREK